MDVITTHLNADFDGLASMVAARKLYPGALLVFPGGAQEHVRTFLAAHDLGITRIRDLDFSKVTRLILVDTQESERVGPLKALWANPNLEIHVFDHHPSQESEPTPFPSSQPHFQVVEPVGASTTVLIEQLQKDGQILTPFEATVLAIGLYEETGSLSFASTTSRDVVAVAYLLRAGADLNVVTDTLRDHLNPQLITLLNDLLQSSDTHYVDGHKILVASSTYDQFHGDLAEVVQKLGDLKGYDAIVAFISMEEKIQLIGRSRHPEIDVGKLAREFGGGGHAVAASACIKGHTLIEVKERVVHLLMTQYRPTLNAQEVMTAPVKDIDQKTTAVEAERLMTQYGVNVLPVLDAKRRYIGLLSRETIQKALFHKFYDSPVDSLLETHAFTATPSTPFHEIERHMIERNQRFVPILKSSKVVGVITRTDLLRTLHEDVLASGRVRSKGEDPPHSFGRRNLRGRLKEALPSHIFEYLQKAGQLAEEMAIPAFVVGGFVRDLLLCRRNLDIDLVIEGDGIAFARAFSRRYGTRVKIHERFGTAIVIFPDGFKWDIATARTEYYEYPTALPTVEKSSIKKDLHRRDFTINTLAIRLGPGQFGQLLDFFGGQRDLNDKTIRVLHSLSFVEDPTRIFRAIRFEQRFEFRLGKETLALIKGAVTMDLFHRLSKKRLLDEIIHLLSEPLPRKGLARLAELDLLRFLHPKLKWSPKLSKLLQSVEDTLDWYRLSYFDRIIDPWVVYFMALMEVLPNSAMSETLKRLAVPVRQAKKIHAGHGNVSVLRPLAGRPAPKPSETFGLLEGLDDETLLFLMGKSKSESVKRQISNYLTTYQRVTSLLTGKDLQSMGLNPGPGFKKILTCLKNARLNGDVKTEADERTLVKRLVKSQGLEAPNPPTPQNVYTP